MEIEMVFTEREIEDIFAKNCRKEFDIDVRNISSEWAEPRSEKQIFVKVKGDYQPE